MYYRKPCKLLYVNNVKYVCKSTVNKKYVIIKGERLKSEKNPKFLYFYPSWRNKLSIISWNVIVLFSVSYTCLFCRKKLFEVRYSPTICNIMPANSEIKQHFFGISFPGRPCHTPPLPRILILKSTSGLENTG